MRTKLAEFVREQAGRRESTFEPTDVDRRGRRSAERLRRLAAHVESLPDDDVRLVALAHVHDQHGHDAFVVGDDASYLVSRFGFDADDAAQGLDEFLTKFVTVLVAADRRDQLEEMGGQLRSAEVDALLARLDDADS